MTTNFYFTHLDDLRKRAKLSIKFFCTGICDDRTYRRYRSNERTIPQEMINLFCEKLSLSQDEFYNSFSKSDTNDYTNIGRLYILITNDEMEQARNLMITLNNTQLKTTNSKKFLKLCNIFYDIRSMNPSYPLILLDLRKLIHYPACLEKEFFNFVEIAAMDQIAFIQATKNREFKDAENLYNILQNRGLVNLTTNTRYYMGTIYNTIAQAFGYQGDLEKSLKVSIEGISFLISSRDTQGLQNLYYFASLCCFKLNRTAEAYEYAKKSIATCVTMNDQKEMDHLNNLYLTEQGYEIKIDKR